jgi:glycosyltransferase involved in cell wall biosynthesis
VSLHLCFISEELPPETGWGGIGTYTRSAAIGLAELGHRVSVVTRTWEGSSIQVEDGVTVHRVPVPPPRWRRGTQYLTAWFKESREIVAWNWLAGSAVARIHAADPIDVIEAPEYHAQAAGVALRAYRIPLVVRLHTPAFLCKELNETAPGGSALDTRLALLAERIAATRANLVASPSRDLARIVGSSWGLPEIQVLPYPLDESFLAQPPVARRTGEIVYVGRLEQRKGVDVLARALPEVLERHPEARVRMVGADHRSGPDGTMMSEHMCSLLLGAGVATSVLELTGPLERSQMPAVYGAADICVIPSRWENFPYACLEAMASGCAVVASRVGGLAEIIEDGVSGLLVEPGDCDGLGRAVTRLLDSPEEARRMGDRGRTLVAGRFARREVCRQMAAMYATVTRR